MNNGPNTDADEVLLQTADPEVSWTWSYVLSALQIPHQILNEDNVFYLRVPSNQKTQAIQEIEDYFLENSFWPRKCENSKQSQDHLQPPTLLLVGSLCLFYAVTGSWDGNSLWFQKGAGNSQAILENFEWYRLVTALTLHADLVHLLNNCILGGFLLHFFFLIVGSGLGLFTLLFAAAAGNYINVLLHGSGHIFIGFSTAVFAAIGLLSMLKHKDNSGAIGSYVLVPLMAGAALLAMLGSAGERTDLGAHFFGLLCGLLAGKMLCLPLMQRLRNMHFLQTLLFLTSVFIILISWILALGP
jgi:rhomboid protease GluP